MYTLLATAELVFQHRGQSTISALSCLSNEIADLIHNLDKGSAEYQLGFQTLRDAQHLSSCLS
jgi:hypothetical protein